jgi:hypothetical protein
MQTLDLRIFLKMFKKEKSTDDVCIFNVYFFVKKSNSIFK